MSVSKSEIPSTPGTEIIIVTTEPESSAVSDLLGKGQEKVSTPDRTEIVMDLSMKKKKKKLNDSSDQAEQATTVAAAGDAVKVEMIPSAFEVKISELIINADKKQTELNEGGGDGDSPTERKLVTTQRPKRAKKRKQAPEKIIQGCKGSDYVISQQQDLPTTEIVIETTDADNDGFVTKESNGDTVHVETILEVETSKPAIVEESDKEDGVSLPLKVPTVTVTTTSSSESDSTAEATATELPLTQLQSSIFSSSVLGSNTKPMRPFKLYTQNRDLLAGIGLNQNNMNTLAAALTGRPLASSAIVASTASLPITAFAPLNMKNPLIPTTIPTGVPETTISQVGSTAGSTDGKLLSVAPSIITSTTTSSAMRLMTLATAADKILKGKKEEQSDAPDKDVNVPLIIAASDGSAPAVGHVNEDGTIELTLDATSPERLSLIQQQIALTPSSDSSDEPKSKKNKKRQQLPDSMKTPNYWERRRKNNEAAKRSRDARRAKEDQIAIRAAILEHENTRLKIELKALKEETAKLRAEIYERKQADSK